jgi:hypothetical protein
MENLSYLENLVYFVIFVCAINFLVLIGIAGSLTKLIKYTYEEKETKGWSQILQSRRNANDQGRPFNYVDLQDSVKVANGKESNWDGIPKIMRNWDGVPVSKE